MQPLIDGLHTSASQAPATPLEKQCCSVGMQPHLGFRVWGLGLKGVRDRASEIGRQKSGTTSHNSNGSNCTNNSNMTSNSNNSDYRIETHNSNTQLNCRCNYLCNCRRCRCLSSVFRDRLRSLARSRPRARLPESWRLEPLKSTKVD